MKKAIIAVTLLLGLGGVSLAQGKGAAANKEANHRMADLTEKLDLTPTQQAEIKAIHAKYQPEVDRLKAGGQQNQEAVRSIREQERNEVMTVLTPEQRAELQNMRQERMQSRKNKSSTTN
jgi:Spy/CpxP family protein refolding chaperone